MLDTVARSAARFCGAYDVCIFRLDGDYLRLDAHHGPVAQPDGFLLPVVKGSVGGRTVLERRVIHVTDLPAETAEFPEAAANARRLGFRTILSVPLVREDVAIGVIQLRRAEASVFTDKQIALLQTFADQAVIAIENVRLFTELQEKNGALTGSLERQTATSEVLRAIAHTQTDAQPVFDTIVQSAARLCRAHTTAVFLTDGRTLSHPANYGGPPDALAAVRARYPRPVDMDTAPGMAVLTRSIVHIADSEAPPVVEHVRQVGRVLGFRSTVIVPMLREGEAVGAIGVTRREPGRFSDAEVDLLKTFADQAVIAIENVRLFTELQEQEPCADRGAGAADRHRRGPPGHQPLRDGCPTGLPDHRRERRPPERRALRLRLSLRRRADSHDGALQLSPRGPRVLPALLSGSGEPPVVHRPRDPRAGRRPRPGRLAGSGASPGPRPRGRGRLPERPLRPHAP